MKPNLFEVATKELSQDGFFTWLLRWANPENSQYNKELNETAQDFIRLLLSESKGNDNYIINDSYVINKVEVWRPWGDIDILANVNDEFIIVIEDKTNTGEHSDQLRRYKDFVLNYYKDTNFKHCFVYLKTGNESSSSLDKIRDNDNIGYKVIDRKSILSVINKRKINNDIFTDFCSNLNKIENDTNSYEKLENITSNWRTAEGFYARLEKEIKEWSAWKYVPNEQGGFLGFWYHFKDINSDNTKVGTIYIQIENAFGNGGITLKIRFAVDWVKKTSVPILRKIFGEITPVANKYGLTINKPESFRSGKSSALAVVQGAVEVDDCGNFDLPHFLDVLKRLEQTLNEYSEK